MKTSSLLSAIALTTGIATGAEQGTPVAAANQFTATLLDAVNSDDANRFLSPFSVRMALAMTSMGAAAGTLDEMNEVLVFDTASGTAAFGKETTAQIAALQARDVELSLANGLWIERGFPVVEDFEQAVKSDFSAKIEAAGFSENPENERLAINAWVADNTQDKIPDLFAEGEITGMTRVVLANAVYFKGKWKTPFPEAATVERPFTNADGSTNPAPMMKLQADFGYTDDGQFQVLELPYKGDQLAMLILLPKDPAQKGSPAAWLTDTAKSASLSTREVSVTLPRFTIRERFGLTETLKKLGMRDAFSDAADFSRMSPKHLQISTVVHEAFIAVDEEGTEAAAATGVGMKMTMLMDPPVEFTADRPFWFFIRDRQSGLILFVGRLSEL